MKLLEERIQRDGTCIGTEIVKVDSFLNHQLDVALIREIGKEFARLFKNDKPNKVLTIEASGIPLHLRQQRLSEIFLWSLLKSLRRAR